MMWSTSLQHLYCFPLTAALLPCRAAMPVVTAAVAVFVERKVPTKTEAIALLLLVSGVIVSVFEGQASGSSYGITLSITGKLFASSYSIQCEVAMMSRGGYP